MGIIFDGAAMAHGATVYITWPTDGGFREVPYKAGFEITDAELQGAPEVVLEQVESVIRAGIATRTTNKPKGKRGE